MKDKIKELFQSENINCREQAFCFSLFHFVGDNDILESYFYSLINFNFQNDPYRVQEIYPFFELFTKNSEKNFKTLSYFFSTIKNKVFKEQFFALIYNSPIEYQKKYQEIFFENLSELEKEMFENLWLSDSDLNSYEIDELFLKIYRYFKEKEFSLFSDIDRRYLLSIFHKIYHHDQKNSFFAKVLLEPLNDFYLSNYLILLSLFTDVNHFELLKKVLSVFPDLNSSILSTFFQIKKDEKNFILLLKTNGNLLPYLSYFSLDFIKLVLSNFIKKGVNYIQKDVVASIITLSFIKDYENLIQEWIKEDSIFLKTFKNKIDCFNNFPKWS